jgi:CheY-like chemotaxis protein
LRQTNEQLALTNAELARATRLKNEFLANMSHELRTPLNAILGLSEALLDELYGSVSSQQQKVIATIERSGKHLLELINDILDLAKIESGRLTLEYSMVPVQNLCESSLGFIRQLAFQKNLQVHSHVSSQLSLIYVDDRRLRQALINLLSNAVKFTPAGGSITLEVQPDPGHTQINFSVIDTGIGIAAADLEGLFQPFVQVDSQLNRQYSGTGLGLALVKQIASLHGGSVSVVSEVGQGSQFTLSIPWQSQGTCQPDADLPNSSGSRQLANALIVHPLPPLVLLAEDDEINIDLFQAYLVHCGYQLVLARNGIEAVKMAKAYHPQLILMDIQMPQMDGLEAIQLIRQEPNCAQIPIIALTALAMPEDQEKCLAAGASRYLTKPVKLKHLSGQIETLLSPVRSENGE